MFILGLMKMNMTCPARSTSHRLVVRVYDSYCTIFWSGVGFMTCLNSRRTTCGHEYEIRGLSQLDQGCHAGHIMRTTLSLMSPTRTRSCLRGRGNIYLYTYNIPPCLNSIRDDMWSSWYEIKGACLNSRRTTCGTPGTSTKSGACLNSIRDVMRYSWYEIRGLVSTQEGRHVVILAREKGLSQLDQG